MSDERADPVVLQAKADPWFEVVKDRTHFARMFCHGKRVLDAPCGLGWSTKIFAETAESVLGVDYSEESIEKARQSYACNNTEFQVMDCLDIKVQEASFDVAVSIEAIEHFNPKDVYVYIAGLARALKPGGVLVGTTPSASDRKSAEIRLINEKNEFHLKIYWPSELRKLLLTNFESVWICEMPFGCFAFVARKKLGIKEKIRLITPHMLRPWLTRARGGLRFLTGV